MSSCNSGPEFVFFKCGKRAQLRTSLTMDNPGRKFHGCVDWKNGGCNFFSWADEQLDPINHNIILGLHHMLVEREMEMKKLTEEISSLKALLGDARTKLKKNEKEKQSLKKRMLFSWIFFVLVWLVK